MSTRFLSDRPIYLQMADEVCRRVVRGDLAPGAQLPSVRDTAAAQGVNPNTVQRAYEELETRGITTVHRGQGTFVTLRPDAIRQMRTRLREEATAAFVADMVALGCSRADMMKGLERAWIQGLSASARDRGQTSGPSPERPREGKGK